MTFWHGWSQPHEVKAIDELVAKFQAAHPNIKVKTVGNMADDKITQGIRSGNGPDVVSSFTTDNVGQFCASGSWDDLTPDLAKSGIDLAKTFPAPVLEYTRFKDKQCALPLLADAFGMYYNKDLFAAAGITTPPKTMSELKADAIKLTKYNTDGSLKVAGFMPTFRTYESLPKYLLGQWQPKYFDADGKSNLAREPAVKEFLTWQRDMVTSLGGYGKLEKFRGTFGDEFSPQNAFETGKIAMILDGEWRTVNLATDKVPFGWATAPFPVPDSRADAYGAGYLSGTIVGISKTSKHKDAAWELVRYLSTDTDALVGFANAIHNVPSTFASLDSSELKADEKFRTFVDVFKSPHSITTPPSSNGGKYLQSFLEFCFKSEAGQISDIQSSLEKLDKQIDIDQAQVGG